MKEAKRCSRLRQFRDALKRGTINGGLSVAGAVRAIEILEAAEQARMSVSGGEASGVTRMHREDRAVVQAQRLLKANPSLSIADLARRIADRPDKGEPENVEAIRKRLQRKKRKLGR